MLINDSVALNLSTCYGNTTCAMQRDEQQQSTPWLTDGRASNPHSASRGRSPQRGCKGHPSRKDTEEQDSRMNHGLHWIRANCRIGPWTTDPPPYTGESPPFPRLLCHYVRDQFLWCCFCKVLITPSRSLGEDFSWAGWSQILCEYQYLNPHKKNAGWDGHLANHLPELQNNRQLSVLPKN